MTRTTGRIVYWLPRILTILFAAFVSLFALDVFGEGLGFWGTLVALLMHLVPTAIILAVLAVAWRWEWVGALAYAALAVVYVVMVFGRFPLTTYVAISGPLVLIGALFLVNWIYRSELRVAA